MILFSPTIIHRDILDMNSETVVAPIKDLPERVGKRIVRELGNFSVPLNFNNKPIGSGTLVQYQDRYGILTASHVLHETGIKIDSTSKDHLGIGVLKTENCFSVPCELIVELDIGSPPNCKYGPMGPDVAVLLLPFGGDWVNTVKMGKTFYNLLSHEASDEIVGSSQNFAMSGFPADSTRYFTDASDEKVVIARHIVFSGHVNTDEYRESDGFDYVEIHVRDEVPEENLKHYNGMSGGGLWNIPINIDDAQDFSNAQIAKISLSGVVYYQDWNSDSKRLLRSHGPKTILKVAQAMKDY